MYPYNEQFLDDYHTSKPMVLPPKIYTNETNQANSSPLPYAANDPNFYSRVGVKLNPLQDVLKPAANPMHPTAPDPKSTAEDTNTKAVKNPVVWIGLAAGVFLLFWLVRHG